MTWLQRFECRLRALGASRYRIYERGQRVLAGVLASRGYRRADEVSLVAESSSAPRGTAVRLRPVCSVEDWAAKLDLHRGGTPGPDGHTVAVGASAPPLALMELAAAEGARIFGALAAADGPALDMYRRTGLVPAGCHSEWVRAP